jgi:excinuclease ABC subunit A
MASLISIRGARTHNLANINLDIPRDKLIVVTGPSGSGKSSLVVDVLYASAYSSFVEALSPYARQFLGTMDKPEVDHISGLSPAIAIQQKTISHNPRSTVGTLTEIYDYLRVLFARIGEPYCPYHNTRLAAQTISQMVDHILTLPKGSRFLILAPIIQKKKGEHTKIIDTLRKEGYLRVRWNGTFQELADLPILNKKQHHTLEVVVDRLMQQEDIQTRLANSLETALALSGGLARIAILENDSSIKEEWIFSSRSACPECNYSIPTLEPRLFSFNNTLGACPDCNGLGINMSSLSWEPTSTWKSHLFDIDPHSLQEATVCETCHGERLRLEARHVFLGSISLPQLTKLPFDELQQFFDHLQLSSQQTNIANELLREINNRISFLLNVGLDYLTLSRSAATLSGGESQRIRLASQIGSGLVGVLYILDEPSIGLHSRDNTRLLQSLYQLRNLGNTVIVIEHDEEAMRDADYLIDIGPGAGVHGGRVVAQGTPQEIIEHPDSLTGQYLSGKRKIAIPKARTPRDPKRVLHLEKVSENNLKNVTLDIPLGLMTCITGVSGSGKSSLINQALYPKVSHLLGMPTAQHHSLDLPGLEHLDKVINIDQKPIGRTPRSNPATYVGLFDPIRVLFSATEEARARGYKPGRFSFNVPGGRCNACEGAGLIKVEMHFLADVHVQCEVCQGKRYNRETLEILYKQKNIYEILAMTIEEAGIFFKAIPAIARKLDALHKVGLNYITLGQSATTFSGGEAQRIKLARELSKRDTGKTLYILDEPTTGLHFSDTEQLLSVLHQLRDLGNTIVIIEHNLDVIKTADWVIDLGPEGGNKGGEIICTGTPEMVSKELRSYTGQYLKPILETNQNQLS